MNGGLLKKGVLWTVERGGAGKTCRRRPPPEIGRLPDGRGDSFDLFYPVGQSYAEESGALGT